MPRLLLLLPVLGEEDLPAEAFDMVADALVRVGAPVAGVRRLARLLLTDHPLWEPVTWAPAEASPLSGGGEPYPGILRCDGEWSPRSGVRLAAGITREQNERLARALGTWDGSSPSEP
ncbi:hypothetical protein AB0C52_04535 [Streptomyces sp. NPDC048717]|uniref:hypothetical protein n=1 Tax=Streptomyces sp. NPDC048717 TaxID=3154928 RepID=UPI003416B400